MATEWQEGDKVSLADREVKNEDTKSGLFYSYFRGLSGVIQKLYSDGLAAVEIIPESLPEMVQLRHAGVQEQMRSKWMDSLSEEAKNRLTEPEKNFRIRYNVLVAQTDLAPPVAQIQSAPASEPEVNDVIHQITEGDLTAAEEEELARRTRIAQEG